MWGSTGCHVTPACLHSGYRQWVSSDLWSSHRQRQTLIAGFSPHTFSHCLSSWPHDALDHAWGVQNLQLKASDCKLLCSFFDCFNSLLHILRRYRKKRYGEPSLTMVLSVMGFHLQWLLLLLHWTGLHGLWLEHAYGIQLDNWIQAFKEGCCQAMAHLLKSHQM